ncbi:hypothetical protein HUK80_01015 [Flavobacterium sp. MAH-1]|uniref:DUF3575 domain-containing protein n=1 Tax=Flavobacterium agri TaxID=2743471 RepID=A0A7Y9C4M6_9FLAO|nr:hypothetical protein [Flavobacterium agri]NUY79459.1 hypothetical protein [Flavobacterium agri]NYA69484.1 hypothetical protein [Flavobacterium agri]
MKHILLLVALILAQSAFAQREGALTAYLSVDQPSTIGVSVEFPENGKLRRLPFIKEECARSYLFNLGLGFMGYDNVPVDEVGKGVVIEAGIRQYFTGETQGLYVSNYLSFANIEFENDEDEWLGKYTYFSFFSPETGYKISFDGICVEPFAGVMWRLESPAGIIDNHRIDEWAPRFGLRIGITF